MTVTIKHKPAQTPPAEAPAGPRPRGVSGIASPYFDHDTSLKVADVLHNVGGGRCAPDFLAVKLGYTSIRSGTFLTRVAAARAFGYITTENGNFTVTERALHALSPVLPEDRINAKADAFMAIPLFARLYEDYKGRTIPPEIGLKNLFLNNYKILADRVPVAVRVFMNSAEQCGYFQAGRDRLIRPVAAAARPDPMANLPPAKVAASTAELHAQMGVGERRQGGGGGGDGGGIHSALVGLLRELPKPGASWTPEDQQDFISAFTGLIKFIYPAKAKSGLDALLDK